MVRSVLDLDLRDLGAWQGPVERLERLERMERMEGFRASALRSEAWQAAKTNAPSCRSRRSTSFHLVSCSTRSTCQRFGPLATERAWLKRSIDLGVDRSGK